MTGLLFEEKVHGKCSQFVNKMKSIFGKFPEQGDWKERKKNKNQNE